MHPSFSRISLYKEEISRFSQKQRMGTQQQRMEVQDKDQQLILKIAKSFNFIIPTLIGLLLLVRVMNSQNKFESPFETHPTNMWVFVISAMIYYSAAHQGSMPLAARISGSLTSILLLCFFIPHWLGLAILIVWVCVTLNIAYKAHAV
ncbi:hypothetical protein Ddye_018119 [Dipteronia dyeriana]|uniref:Transmembrane protein n=1 Tax=Dipteronia dyeriana TaxID=168575 RepID=A0AAD9U9Y1_9ROSI|nr:hypothetical protein Ddye_018119 [Dipteronia dyeriana]